MGQPSRAAVVPALLTAGNNADLARYATTDAPSGLQRCGYLVPGDSPCLPMLPSTAPCTVTEFSGTASAAVVPTSTLVIASVGSGMLRVGLPVAGPGIVPGTIITRQIGGTAGGVGSYQLSQPINPPPSFTVTAPGDGGSQVPSADGGCWTGNFAGWADTGYWGALGSGDDTAALSAAVHAIVARGGMMTLNFSKPSYTIGSGLTFNDGATHFLLPTFGGAVSGVRLQGNGAVIHNAATIAAVNGTNAVIFSVTGSSGSGFVVEDMAFVQDTPVTLPAVSPYGTIGFYADSGSQFYLRNIKMNGGNAPFDFSGGDGVVVDNFLSVDSIYGGATPGGASNAVITGRADHVDRVFDTYCTSHQRLHLWSRNSLANDMLIEGCAAPTTDISVDYHVAARTIGSFNASYLTFAFLNNSDAISNIDARVSIDLSGDNSGLAGPAVLVEKGSATGTSLHGVKVSGAISGVGASYGSPVIAWNRAADAPWSGESQGDIDFSDLVVSGSSSAPAAVFDAAPFGLGGLTFRNVASDVGRTVNYNGSAASAAQIFGAIYSRNAVFNGVRFNSWCGPIGGAMLDAAIQASPAPGTDKYYGVAGFGAGNATTGPVLASPNGEALYLRQLRSRETDSSTTTADTVDLTSSASGDLGFSCSFPTGGGAQVCSDTAAVKGPQTAGTAIVAKYHTAASGSSRGIDWGALECTLP